MNFLLDSNVLSEPLRKEPDRKVRALIQQRQFDSCVSATVWEEFLFGIERQISSVKRKQLLDYRYFLEEIELPVLPFDHAAANWMSHERTRLCSEGLTPAYRDLQIAAVAAIRGLTVVTRNMKDFARFQGVRIENWFKDDPH
jgi:tRNA(fMet)-specific endonuclease VapC